MKKSLLIIIVLIAAIFAFASCKAETTTAQEQTAEPQEPATVDETEKETQSEAEEGESSAELDFGAKGALSMQDYTLEAMLEYAIQDEYLARQEYETIIQEYGAINPFSNIMRAEEYHIELLTGLYDDYNLTLPEDTALDYAFIPESLELTYDIGVQAEIGNIAMYEKFLEEDLPDDVRTVFIELRDASENHLAAFEKGPRGGGRGNGR